MADSPDPGRVLPTWQLNARSPASADWQEYRIAATSNQQAEAILRRLGFIVDGSSARIVHAPASDPSTLRPAPGPLRCTQCCYGLDGLTVQDSCILCPECGHRQVVLAFRADAPDDAIGQSRDRRGAYYGAAFGMGCLTGLVLLIAGIAILIIM